MGKVEEKKRLKKEAILASAFQLFTEQGINDTSVADIVKHASLGKGTFYLYFKDKFDLRDKLIARKGSAVFDQAYEDLKNRDMPELEDCILSLVDNILDQLEKNPMLLRFISKNLSWAVFSNIRIAEMDGRNCMDIFEDMIQRYGRTFRNTKMMIYFIVELVSSACHDVILYHSPVSLEELKPELFTTIRGIILQFEVK